MTKSTNASKLNLKSRLKDSLAKSEGAEVCSELRALFIEFLEQVRHVTWNKSDVELLRKVIRKDTTYMFLSQLSDQQLFDFVTDNYSPPGFRMYMLVSTKHFNSDDLRMKALLHFFEDSDETVREEALKYLARKQWVDAPMHAIKLWHSNELTKQMSCLDALSAYESKDLEHYLQLAEISPDDCLRQYARHFRIRGANKF